MTWQRIGLYYLLAFVIGGYYLLFEYRPGGPDAPILEPKTNEERYFLTMKREAMQTISIQRDGQTFVARKGAPAAAPDGQKQGQWNVEEPAGAPVTSALVGGFIDNLTPNKKVVIVHSGHNIDRDTLRWSIGLFDA